MTAVATTDAAALSARPSSDVPFYSVCCVSSIPGARRSSPVTYEVYEPVRRETVQRMVAAVEIQVRPSRGQFQAVSACSVRRSLPCVRRRDGRYASCDAGTERHAEL